MIKLKVRRIGNSCGVTLPKHVLKRLNAGEGDEIIVNEIPNGYQLMANDEAFEAAMKAYERTRKRYRNTLRELAK